MTNTSEQTAKPLPGTIKQIAECRNCGETLQKYAERGATWHHAYTGNVKCW